LTSTFYDGSVDEAAWATAITGVSASSYGVRTPADWKITAVSAADRTVAVAPGSGWGQGVYDTTTAEQTIQLDICSSGYRWDLVAWRRDWSTNSTTLVKINGNATKAIPSGRLTNPGTTDDQPLALVKIVAGASQPAEIVDLRIWAGNGGLFAKDELVLTYLTNAGAELAINDAVWKSTVGTGDTVAWTKVSQSGYIPLFGVGPTLAGGVPPNGTLFLIQAGTTVQYTDNSSYARITWPKPFPNGLLMVMGVGGDDWAHGGSAQFESAGGAGFGPSGGGTRTDWVYAMKSQPASANGSVSPLGNLILGRAGNANRVHRINWIAIGW
jgi:hypothetical protein